MYSPSPKIDSQRLTHFMKILEIFRIQKFVEMFCQNTQFSVRIINMMVYSAILTFAGPQIARVRAYLVKISFLKCSRNLKMSIFRLKKTGNFGQKLRR